MARSVRSSTTRLEYHAQFMYYTHHTLYILLSYMYVYILGLYRQYGYDTDRYTSICANAYAARAFDVAYDVVHMRSVHRH